MLRRVIHTLYYVPAHPTLGGREVYFPRSWFVFRISPNKPLPYPKFRSELCAVVSVVWVAGSMGEFSIKNPAFHSLLRWKMNILPIAHYITYAFHYILCFEHRGEEFTVALPLVLTSLFSRLVPLWVLPSQAVSFLASCSSATVQHWLSSRTPSAVTTVSMTTMITTGGTAAHRTGSTVPPGLVSVWVVASWSLPFQSFVSPWDLRSAAVPHCAVGQLCKPQE